jgi:hypothetical protein
MRWLWGGLGLLLLVAGVSAQPVKRMDDALYIFPGGVLGAQGVVTESAGPPSAALCDSGEETNTHAVDTLTQELYLCTQSGWRKITALGAPPAAVCGDTSIDEGEDCDPPSAPCLAGGVCGATCLCPSAPSCGDLIVNGTEQCDGLGQAQCISGQTCVACSCIQDVPAAPECNNGTIETGEVCDPGGKACTVQAECGHTGTCTSLLCVAVTGTCTNGCSQTCTCNPAPTCTGDFYVDVTGSNTNPGTSGSPFRTVQKGLDTATAGQTVCVRPGTYQERVLFKQNNQILKGISGAVIDGGVPHTSGWQQTSNAVVANANGRVWHKNTGLTAGVDHHHMTLSGKYLVQIRESFVDAGTWQAVLVSGPRTCPESCCGGCTPVHNWTDADAMFAVVGSTTYIGFADGSSANGKNLTVCPEGTATVHTNAKTGVTLSGMEVRGCAYAVYVSPGSTGAIIEQNRIRNGWRAITTDSANTVTIRSNDVSLDYNRPMAASAPRHWALWRVFRSNGNNPRIAIVTSGTSTGTQIDDNTIHDCFDGISDGPTGVPTSSNGLRVFNNVIERCTNDGLMIREEAPNQEWFENRMLDVNQGFRLRVLTGPVWIYRNRIFTVDQGAGKFLEGNCFYVWDGGFDGLAYFYHNSCSGSYGAVFGSGNAAGLIPGTPNFFVWDNIFSAGSAAWNTYDSRWQTGASTAKPSFRYNWLSKPSVTSWMDSTNVRPTSGTARIWPANAVPTFLLPATGPGSLSPRDVGISVRVTDAASDRPWPGFATDYGGAGDTDPDMGAVQFSAQGTTTTTVTTTTTTTTLAGSAPADWSLFFDYVWKMDEAASATRVNSGSGTTGNLTNNNSVGQNTSLFKEGTAAADFDEVTPGDALTNTTATAPSLGYTGAFVAGCWARPEITGFNELLTRTDNSTNGYRLAVDPASGQERILFQTFDFAQPAGARNCGCTTTTGTFPINTFKHVVGIYDGTKEFVYQNGMKTPCTFCDNCTLSSGNCIRGGALVVTSGAHTFVIGNRNGLPLANTWDGQIDECFTDTGWSATSANDGVLDPESLCRICSCEINGSRCTCSGTLYANTGRNAECGNCTLPVCNQAQP